MTERFGLLLFSTDPAVIAEAVDAGVDGIVVDWEQIGKEARQAGADTQVNHYSIEDLRRVRAATDATVVCRLNRFGATTAEEVEAAVDGGADELFLPMVTARDEVERLCGLVDGRCRVGMLTETVAAVESPGQFADLPLARVYAGLNDLALERGTPNLFTAVADGTVERLRAQIPVPFGFGGLTLPDRGSPVPCRLLVGEMARLRCDFAFLRRSYLADVGPGRHAAAVSEIRAALTAAHERGPEEERRDHVALVAAIGAWRG